MHPIAKILSATILGAVLPLAALAQDAGVQAGDDSFASENAVLDTSILFAIGAREARQQLRGAFGWPTFQEGLVEGVYFRFDPDGYARFAPTPRLDTDVFEVICRPRTLVCMGRKDTLQVTLNKRGQVQLEIANITDKDQFILSDGFSELPLPPAILQPLEPRLELLLAAGGEISVRRNNSEVQNLSLAGFGAVIPYLRWVAARQDYTVLPRGWPIPNAAQGNDNPSLTQTASWQSPMPQPHAGNQVATSARLAANPGLVPAAAPAPALAASTVPAAAAQVGTDVAEVRGELNVLRELLIGQQPGAMAAPAAMEKPVANDTTEALVARVNELAQITASLREELHQWKRTGHAPLMTPQPSLGQTPRAPAQMSDTKDVARHLEYLMTEIGLAPDVALMVVQQAQQSQQADTDAVAQDHNRVVSDILDELRAQLPDRPLTPVDHGAAAAPSEYHLLSDYFNFVMSSQ